MEELTERRRQILLVAAGAVVGIAGFAAYLWSVSPGQREPVVVAAPVAAATLVAPPQTAAAVAHRAIPLAPFGFVGAVPGEDGRARYLFSRGDQTYPVAIGETIGTEYRLEGVDDEVASLARLSDGAAAIVPLGGGPGSGSLGLDAVHEQGKPATTHASRAVTQRVREARGAPPQRAGF